MSRLCLTCGTPASLLLKLLLLNLLNLLILLDVETTHLRILLACDGVASSMLGASSIKVVVEVVIAIVSSRVVFAHLTLQKRSAYVSPAQRSQTYRSQQVGNTTHLVRLLLSCVTNTLLVGETRTVNCALGGGYAATPRRLLVAYGLAAVVLEGEKSLLEFCVGLEEAAGAAATRRLCFVVVEVWVRGRIAGSTSNHCKVELRDQVRVGDGVAGAMALDAAEAFHLVTDSMDRIACLRYALRQCLSCAAQA